MLGKKICGEAFASKLTTPFALLTNSICVWCANVKERENRSFLRAKAKRQSPERVTVFLAINCNFDTKTIPRRDSVPFQPHNVL